MKLKTRIILGFTMIILMPLLLFAATLYGFSQSQAQKAQAVTESDGTVYDISITDSADSQGRVHVMAKDLFISAFVILISVALVWLINPYVNQFIRENTSVYEKIQTASGSFVDSLADGKAFF